MPRLESDVSKSIGTSSHPDSLKQEFAKRLRDKIYDRGWNQSELARRASDFLEKPMGRDSVSNYLNARYMPGGTHLYAICKALKVEPHELAPSLSEFQVSPAPSVPFEIKANPTNPTKVRLKIDQELPFDAVLKIMQILESVNADKD